MVEPPPDPKRQRFDDSQEEQQDSKQASAGEAAADDAYAALDHAAAAALQEAGDIQQQVQQVEGACADAILEVEREYAAKKRPLLLRRLEALKRVPQFWSTVLQSHPYIVTTLTTDDINALNYCTGIDIDDGGDMRTGYTVRLSFDADANPYFTNTELAKRLSFEDNGVLKAQCSTVHWRPGQGPEAAAAAAAADGVGDADGAGGVGAKRPRPSPGEFNLFSHWLTDEEGVPGGTDVLAESLKDDITPDPLQWYQQAAANAAQGLPPWAGADAGGGGLLYGGEEGGLVGGSEGGLGEGQLLYDEDEDEDEEGGLDDDDDDADGGGGGGGVYADEGEMYVDEYEAGDDDEAGEGEAGEQEDDDADGSGQC